jgi:uncharacterized protein (DUF2267 family)
MPINFNKHGEKGEQFIKELAHELGNDKDLPQAGRLLQAVFITLRDHLPLEESFQLLSQLPMALKAVYINGWNPSHKHDISRTKKGFIEEVNRNEGVNFNRDFSDIEDGEFVVLSVFKTLRKYVSEGEFNDIEAVLPNKIKGLIKDSDYH